ncbi:MAG: hypothetical protein AAB370_10275, partial [Verrucomicrobiota bacterium]
DNLYQNDVGHWLEVNDGVLASAAALRRFWSAGSRWESGRGLPHSKTLARSFVSTVRYNRPRHFELSLT